MTAPHSAQRRDDRAAVDKAISILVCFGADGVGGVGVSELARRADLSKSTVHRVLATLQRNGVVDRTGTDYRIGTRLHEVAQAVYAPGQEEIRDLLIPHLADLFGQVSQTVHLAALAGTDVVYLTKLYGHQHLPSPSRIGRRLPAHSTAVGKALLAYNPRNAELALEAELRAVTEATITDPAVLAAQLGRIRQEGIAVERGEVQPGLSCIAVPVLDPKGSAVAAFSVSGPAGTLNVAEHATTLRRVAAVAAQSVARRSAERLRQASNHAVGQ